MNAIDLDNLSNWRFARRCGELVPDATYACALERPARYRRTSVLIAWLGIIALLTVGLIASMAL
jgi:hypothetical protein